MAQSNIVKTTAKISTGYLTDKTVTNRIVAAINRGENRFYDESIDAVKKLIKEAVVNCLVYKGLSGEFPNIQGKDLQAEFGIADPRPALDKLVQILIDTVKVAETSRTNVSGGRQANIKLGITWLNPEDYEQKLLDDNTFVVQSHTVIGKKAIGKKKKVQRVFHESYIIEWMRILLDGTASAPDKFIPNINNYGITYDLKNYEARAISRSGRALMTQKPQRTTRTIGRRGNVQLGKLKNGLPSFLANQLVNFPYTMPILAIPKAGRKNFIDEIARSAQLRSLIKNKLDTISKRYLKA